MNCSRCGAAEAVLKRDAAFYCGKCALARDWEEVIALVQEERVAVGSGPTIDFEATAPALAAAPAPPAPAAAPPAPAASASPPATEPATATVAPAPSPNGSTGPAELPADPFA